MEHLTNLLQNILQKGSDEDIQVITDFLANMEKKQQGDFSTYLSAALHMERQLEHDRCTIEMPITPLIHNTGKNPHGGILATLLDTVMGTLANSKCDEGFAAVTTNLNIHYLSVATEQTLRAESKILRKGKHTIVVEGYVLEPDGRLLASSTASFFIIPKFG
ncbi:PaaI family thioesterase [Planococcus salinus]|nr:PaaI family thioesterase [Planococcus salinus]